MEASAGSIARMKTCGGDGGIIERGTAVFQFYFCPVVSDSASEERRD
jgi:hypothetical protein